MIDILNKYNISKKKLIGFIILIAIFLVVLPLTIIQVQKQQQIRQRAQEGNSVRLILDSYPNKIHPDTELTVSLSLSDPQERDISGIDVTLAYNNDVLELVSFNRNAFFSEIVYDKSIPGKIHFVGFNSTLATNLGIGSIEIGKLTFKAITQGAGTVDLSNIIVTATNDQKPLDVNTGNPRLGSYDVVVPSAIPSPIPTLVPTSTAISITTPVPTSTPFPSQKPLIIIPTVSPTNIPTNAAAQNTPVPSAVPTVTLIKCLKELGDADCDGKINILDYEVWKTEFVSELNGTPTEKKSDFNGDGKITIVDFNIWKTNL